MKSILRFRLRQSVVGLGLRLCMALALILANGTNFLVPPVAYAADGDLDPSFGSGGKVTTDFNGSFDMARTLATQSDGKLIAAGYAYNAAFTSSPFALSRYNANGTLDGSFGTGGKVTTDFNGWRDEGRALAMQSDGKIVAAGQTTNASWTGSAFALARYNPNGTLDGSFGTGGKVTTDFNGQRDAALALAIQSDGKLVVAGEAFSAAGTLSSFALARYQTDLKLPLIFVHGVAGSTLVKNGSEIWIGTPFVTSRRELSQVESPRPT